MERYQHGGVNITGFQLVNHTTKYVKNFLKVWRTLDRNIWPGGGTDSINVRSFPPLFTFKKAFLIFLAFTNVHFLRLYIHSLTLIV